MQHGILTTVGWTWKATLWRLVRALPFVIALATHAARADAATPQRPVPGIRDLPPWSLRVSVGAGVPVSTIHEQVLSQEGYDGLRFAFTGSVGRRVHDCIGVGVMGLYGFREIQAAYRQDASFLDGPKTTYSERFSIIAAEVPVTLLFARRFGPWLSLELVPWAGVGFGTASITSDTAWRVGPAFGGTLRVLVRGPRASVGVGLGAYSLRVDTSSLAGPVNFGTYSLSLIGGFDAG